MKIQKMAKTLRVIDSFFVMEAGDIFTLSEDGKFYTAEHNEEFHKSGDTDELNSAFSSTLLISVYYAKQLIDGGYLEEVNPEPKKKFVNIFDEIDSLITRYQNELNSIDTDFADEPQCLKVEKTTVLTNILSVLNHLKTLRK